MANSYRVVAEYVTLKVKDQNGVFVIVGFYKGGIVSAEIEKDSLEHHLDQGMLEEVLVSDEGVVSEGSSDEAPAKSAPKADWEAYARSQGASDADLEGVTKDDLVATYGD